MQGFIFSRAKPLFGVSLGVALSGRWVHYRNQSTSASKWVFLPILFTGGLRHDAV
jgi:hypothetical protein